MTRNLALNRTNNHSGVHSNLTSVSLSGPACSPRQSALKHKGDEISQDNEVGNPSASGASIIRTATAVRSWDLASLWNILVNCLDRSPALKPRGSRQDIHCEEMHKKKLNHRANVFSVRKLQRLGHEPCTF